MNDSASNYSARDRATHLHSFTNLHRHLEQDSLVIEHGEGVYLVDAQGRKYLDAMSSLWCANLGYSEQRLVDAARRQLQQLPYSHTFRGRSHHKLIELAEKLVEITPRPLQKVFFAGSGSEANESAIKMAWSYHKILGKPAKRKIMARRGAYHGSTVFATRLCGMPDMHEYLNARFEEVVSTDLPCFFREARDGETEEVFSDRLASQLEAQILDHGADTIAAFIAEPVMGVGGVILPPEGYFPKIREILRRHDILLIVDEVVCGFGRTGRLFGSQTYAIEPDILTLAKGITSAYFPMSAAVVTGEVYDSLVRASRENGSFSHGFTYSGHPVGAAVALEAIAIIEERDIPGHVRQVGDYFHDRLRSLESSAIVGDTRSIGLMGGFEIYRDPGHREHFDSSFAAGSVLMDLAEENLLFVRAVGDTIVLAPPLVITEPEIDILIERLKTSIDLLEKRLSP